MTHICTYLSKKLDPKLLISNKHYHSKICPSSKKSNTYHKNKLKIKIVMIKSDPNLYLNQKFSNNPV